MSSLYPANKTQANYPRINGLCRTLANYEWLFVALLLPVVLTITPPRFGVLLVIPLLWLIRRIGYGIFIVATPLDVALLFLAIMLLVSLYATFDLTFSLPKIAGLVYGLGVYYATMAAAGRSWSNLARGVGLLLACGLIVALFSLLGTNWKSAIPLLSAIVAKLPQFIFLSSAPEGFSPNQVAGTLLWVLPVAMAAVAISFQKPSFWHSGAGRNRKRLTFALSLALLLLLGSVFILTQSRSAYAGLAVALLFFGLAIRGLSRRLVFIALFISLALAAAGIWYLVEPEWRPETAGLVSQPGSESAGEGVGEGPENQAMGIGAINMQARLEIWSRALYGLEDFPFTGLGLGTFRRVVPVLYPLFLVAPDQDIAHAHNQFLQVGLDLGLPGLITYLAVWLGAAAMLWQSWKLAPTNEARWLVLGFATALLAYLLYGISETVALGAKPGFIFWLLLGLASSLYQLTYSSQSATYFSSIDHRRNSDH